MERELKRVFSSEKFMVVAGGTGQNEPGQGRTSVEVLSLDEANVPLPDCLNLLGDLDYSQVLLGGAPLRRGLANSFCYTDVQ